jgi:hypothetical protein
MLQRHLAVKLLLICNIEKMAENVLPPICQKIINLRPLLCTYVVHWKNQRCLCGVGSLGVNMLQLRSMSLVIVNGLFTQNDK